MKNIIIVSVCTKVVGINHSESWYHFHFKGVCAGEVLSKVVLRADRDFGIVKGKEYLMYINLTSFEEGTLIGKVIKCRHLEECWDKS